ncbi:hypothetical protein DL765_004116 [Monosporascus sp. GIB2]|nr:hypothetical protein DL765_004116 [Monosporascus sp. GIB2]
MAEPLVTSEAIFSCSMTNMLIGAYDARTLYSNYVTDMVFDYEHSYHTAFPGFENLTRKENIGPHTNNRHVFCRRSLLGYPKARKTPGEQREGALDDGFDENLRIMRFSRPLKNACNESDLCDAAERLLVGHEFSSLLAML